MSLRLKHYLRRRGVRFPLTIALSLLLGVSEALSQTTHSDGGAPKYDQKTESKAKGTIDEINLLTVGSRKDFVQLIVKNGADKISAYVCPKPFQDEMGITFSKGDQVSMTGSKVKQEDAEVFLVRELEKGTDTLMFRDDKGNPVWDWRTGK